MGTGRLQTDVEERIVWLLRAGVSQRQIAYECRVDRDTVGRVAQRRRIAPVEDGIRRCELCRQRIIGACITCATTSAAVEDLPRVDRGPDREDPRPWEIADFYMGQHARRTHAGELIQAADADRLQETLEELTSILMGRL